MKITQLQMALSFLRTTINGIIEIKENDMKLIKDATKKQAVKKDLDELRQAQNTLNEAGELNEAKQKKALEEVGKMINAIVKRKNKVTPFKN